MDKKTLRTQVEAKIEAALAGLPKDLSDKKFKKHIKKAAKILSEGLTVSAPAKDTPDKADPKKAKAAPKKAVAKKAVKTPKKAK